MSEKAAAMDEMEKQAVLDRYSGRLKERGYSPETLGWGKKRHFLRYRILLGYWDLKGASLLDFGCGFGDMYGYCRREGLGADYVGVDIHPDLIATGKGVYPEADLRAADYLRDGLDKTYDVIVASGVYSLKLKDNAAFIKQSFDLFAAGAKQGFAANFMSDRVDYRDEHLYYADPGEIMKLALSYSNRVLLRHDYMPYEFTVFVDKRNVPDKALNVYPEYVRYV